MNLEERFKNVKLCSPCLVDLGGKLVKLCDKRNKGESCKEEALKVLEDWGNLKIDDNELINRLKKIFGDDYLLGYTEVVETESD